VAIKLPITFHSSNFDCLQVLFQDSVRGRVIALPFVPRQRRLDRVARVRGEDHCRVPRNLAGRVGLESREIEIRKRVTSTLVSFRCLTRLLIVAVDVFQFDPSRLTLL